MKLDGRTQDKAWWRDVVDRTFSPFGPGRDPDGMFEILYGHFAEPETWKLYPGVRETLVALRARGFRTGLISNWDGRLRSLLAGHGLIAGLDPVVISWEVGAEKPAAEIYRTALTRAAVKPGRALMVGDDPEADVEGALAQGMQALLVDWSVGVDSPHEILRCVADLLDLLPEPRGTA